MTEDALKERRRRRRLKKALRAECLVDGMSYRAGTLDIHTSGMGVFTAQRLPKKKIVQLRCFLESGLEAEFKVIEKYRKLLRSKKGQLFNRVGLEVVDAPENVDSFFEELFRQTGKILGQPVIELPSAQEENVLGSIPDDLQGCEPTLMGIPTTHGYEASTRKLITRDSSLPNEVLAKVNQSVFRCLASDLSPAKLRLWVPTDFPKINLFLIKIVETESGDLLLKVREERRTTGRNSDGNRFLWLDVEVVEPTESYENLALQYSPLIEETNETVSEKPRSPLLSKYKYQYEKKLGKGGFAEVFLVTDVALNRRVAMKILHPKYANDPELSQRFIAEAQIAAKFHHPNIALVYEVGVYEADQYRQSLDFPDTILDLFPDRIAYFTMQYIEGRTLSEILKNEGKINQFQTLKIFHEVGKALSFAHAKDVVHRDIKPENIMITFDGQILVTDFGIAKVLRDQQHASQMPQLEDRPTVEQTDGFLGTPNYVSPEQANGQAVDGRSDIYSLGITAYELLTGRPPFIAEDWIKVLGKHLYEEPLPLREIEPDLHPNVASFVHKCLAKKPAERFQGAEELLKAADDVERFLHIDPIKVAALEEVDEEARELVKKLFLHFSKTMKSIATYPGDHEMVHSAKKLLNQLFVDYFDRFERLDLEVESMALRFQRIEVLQEDQRDNAFCFNLYRDGIRSLTFFRGFSLKELDRFMNAIHGYLNTKNKQEKDSVTLLFQMGFQYVDFEYVDGFFESSEHLLELRRIQTQVMQERDWDYEALVAGTQSLDRMIPFFDHLHQLSENINREQLVKMIDRSQEPQIRKEAVRIALHMVEQESDEDTLEHQYRLIEQVIFTFLQEQNVREPLFILNTLATWAERAPNYDPKKFRTRWQDLSRRLCDEAVLDNLLEVFFKLRRDAKPDILAFCRYLHPEMALAVLFQRFCQAREEWKKIFLAELCVTCSTQNSDLLVEHMNGLDDPSAALLIHAARVLMEELPKSVFSHLMTFPGPETRLALIRELALLKRRDTLQFLKQGALETQPRFHQSKREAWAHLSEHHPRDFANITKRFLDLPSFKNLSTLEKKLLFQYLESTRPTAESLGFLSSMVAEQGVFGQNPIQLEDRKKAAALLKKTGGEQGAATLRKVSKKLLGNRELIHYCKKLLEDA